MFNPLIYFFSGLNSLSPRSTKLSAGMEEFIRNEYGAEALNNPALLETLEKEEKLSYNR